MFCSIKKNFKTFLEKCYRNLDMALQNPMQALRFSTANVGTLVGRSAEAVDMLNRRKVGVAGLQKYNIRMLGQR